jgi:hypothetical protein
LLDTERRKPGGTSYTILPKARLIFGEVPAASQQIIQAEEPARAGAVFSIHGARAQVRMEGNMSDPRFTDPRYSQSQLSDRVGQRIDTAGGTWGWVAGLVVIALIAIFLIAGGKGVSNTTASNAPPPVGGAPVRNDTPKFGGTTGMGSPSQIPARPPATNGSGQ